MRSGFIVSSGRTGTQFLAHYLDANFAEVRARHEPFPSRLLRVASHMHASGWLTEAHLEALLRRVRTPGRDAAEGLRWSIESNPFLAGFAPVLGRVFERPLLVHIVRDPRDSVRSAMNHGSGSGLKGFANRRIPFWYPDVERMTGLTSRLRGPYEWPLRAALHWQVLNDRLAIAARDLTLDYLRIEYERLFDARRSGLRVLVEALELHYPEDEEDLSVSPAEARNRGRLDVLPAWPEWPAELCREFEALCGDAMRRYGYGHEPAWHTRVDRS